MSELANLLNDLDKIVGITPTEEPTAQELSAPKPQVIQKNEQQTKKENDELKAAKDEYSRLMKIYNQQHTNKIQRQLAAVNKIYEFTKIYHENKQSLLDKTKGLSKVLHPVQAKQAQQELEKLREENKKNRDFLHNVAPNYKIETVAAELIKKDGINLIYDYEIQLETIEEIMSYLKNCSPKLPFYAFISPKPTASDYIRAANALKEHIKK